MAIDSSPEGRILETGSEALGPAINQCGECVYELASSQAIPVIGVCGMPHGMTRRDYDAGARAVQLERRWEAAMDTIFRAMAGGL
jgi:hypothetical protein